MRNSFLAISALLLVSIDLAQPAHAQKGAPGNREVVIYLPHAEGVQSAPIGVKADAFGITPPIRETAAYVQEPTFTLDEFVPPRRRNNKISVVRGLPDWTQVTNDPLAALSRQRAQFPAAIPGPALTFEGISSNGNAGLFGTTSLPPDTIGDVGPNHYVQSVNFGTFRIYDKAGNPLSATMRISTLFAGLPITNKCRTTDNGDPVVLYDPLADRWLVTQFALSNGAGEAGPPYFQCIAISQTGDPTGAYYAYGFKTPSDYFHDYPHFGVWPDGYYMAAHEFNALGTGFVEAGFFAFDRDRMLAGDPGASYVYIGLTNHFGHMPADVDGYMPPPDGTPAMFFENLGAEFGAPFDQIISYEMVPDFEIPANTTLTVKPAVATAPFDPRDPGGSNDIEQPSPAVASQYLDSIGSRMMQRVTYRNLGTVAAPLHAYAMTWNVNVSGATPNTAGSHQSGVRWTEMRRSGGGVMSIFDQGTHAPDPPGGSGRNRWMGSIAQDHQGNLALGFSRSGSAAGQFPDIVWAGRSGGIVAAGTMNEGEATMFASTGVQQSTSGRWGDYSSMSVDPADDCTFWYSTEYRLAAFNGGGNNPFFWNTRVGTFQFPACTPAPRGNIAVTVTECASDLPVVGAMVTAAPGGFSRQTQAGGVLASNFITAPGSYGVTASYRGVSASGNVVVSNGSTSNLALCLSGPFIVPTTATIAAEGCAAANGSVDPGETVTVNLGLQNVAGATTVNLRGSLAASGGVMIPGPAQDFGAVVAGAAATVRPFTFTASPTLQCGQPIELTLNLSDGGVGVGTLKYSLPGATAAGATVTIPYAGSTVAIPDDDGTVGATAIINVSGQSARIQDLNFRINGTSNTNAGAGISHTWVGDLGITLTSPAGTVAGLVNQINDTVGNNGNCSVNHFFNTVLDDEAGGNPVDSQCAVGSGITGTFRPDYPLSVFDGEDPNGIWQLTAKDGFAGDVGTIRAFSLVLTSYACCQTKIWTGALSSAWTTAGNWSPSGAPGPTDHAVIPTSGVSNEPLITSAVSIRSIALAAPRTLTVGVGGSLTVSTPALSQAAGTVIYAGSAAQTLLPINFHNLTINNPAGVSFTTPTTVLGTLTLSSGQLSSAGSGLSLSNCTPAALSGGGAGSYVRAALTRCIAGGGSYVFPVGTASGYSPLDLSAVQGSGNFSVLAIQGPNPNVPADSVQRYWTLTPGPGVGGANLLFHYLASDLIGGNNEASYHAYRIEPGPIALDVGGTVNTVAHTLSVLGVTQFSDWAIGAPQGTVPDPPIIGTATAGNGQVTISFSPPANNGGSEISSYTATCGGQSNTGPGSPLVVAGLSNGSPVTCTVIATNAIGDSAPSAVSNQVTPFASPERFLTVGAVTLPATTAATNATTRIDFPQAFQAVPVVIVQPDNTDADPQAVRIIDVDQSGFNLLQVEPVGCVGCTGAGGAMTVHWLAALPGSYRLPDQNPGPGVLLKVGTTATSASQRALNRGGFASWPAPSWEAIAFPAVAGFDFGAAPIVLSTVQSWSVSNEGSNLSLVPTPRLTGTSQVWLTSVVRNITAAGFEAALESSSADNNGSATAGVVGPDAIGWVAIESGVSTQLNTVGGAGLIGLATGGGSINGNCTATTLTFPAATAIALPNVRGFASKQSRNEDDGGWVRRCSFSNPSGSDVTINARVDEDADLKADRSHPSNEAIGVAMFSDDFSTTPVSLAFVQSSVIGDQIDVSFGTATETAHLGYRIWGRADADSDWLPLHEDLLINDSGDSFVAKSYRKLVSAPGVTQIRIEDVDILGQSRFHAAMTVGTSVGSPALTSAISWGEIRAANLASPIVTSRPLGPAQVIADVSAVGIQRLDFAELAAAGFPGAVDPAAIAVLDESGPVARYVDCGQATFGPGCAIEWLGEKRTGRYGSTRSYVVTIDRENAIRAASSTVPSGGSRVVSRRIEHAPDRAYSVSAPGDDPWYDQRLATSSNPVSLTRVFSTPNRVPGPVVLTVNLWGGLDYQGSAPDHSVEIRVNGQLLTQHRFDGLIEEAVSMTIPDTVLTESNTLSVRLPADTGYPADVVLLEGFQVTYAGSTTLSEGELAFGDLLAERGAAGDIILANGFETPLGFTLDGVDAPTSVWTRVNGAFNRDLASTELHLDRNVDALVAAEMTLLQRPSVRSAAAPVSVPAQVDYLIVSHPQFVDQLAPLVGLQQSRGLQVAVVRIDEIYAALSFHQPDPVAITEVINAVAPRFVLLVGGDSYDYDDNLGLGSTSYLPTYYREATPVVRYAVSDLPFADDDGDGSPERALGRLPVRTDQELQRVLGAILARANSAPESYFAAAGPSNYHEHFDLHSRALMSYLRQGQPTSFGLADEIGLGPARDASRQALGGDSDWINYIGHSSPSRWALENLLDIAGLATVERTGLPAVVSQWGCWNNYFVLPNQESMSHALMLRENTLAAAVIGSTSLAEDSSHMALAVRFFDLIEDGWIGEAGGPPINTIGEALQAAQQDVAQRAPEHKGSNYSINLLGDPAMPLR